jgi:hypothetical protein
VHLGALVTLWQERQNRHQGTKALRNTRIFFVILGVLVPWWQKKSAWWQKKVLPRRMFSEIGVSKGYKQILKY